MPDELQDPTFTRWLDQSVPGEGWIRAVRTQKNMLGKQLAQKLRVSAARISVLEKDERRGAVTLKMMQKAAEALDCRFVYALIPKTPARDAKPRIRLDSASMKSDAARQARDLQQAYRQCVSETTPD